MRKERELESESRRTSVSSLVNFKVLGSSEDFSAARKRTGERFLACVHTDVIHKLVFCLERLALTYTLVPVAYVNVLVGVAGCAHMIHSQVGDNFVHSVEDATALLACACSFLINPQAYVVLFKTVQLSTQIPTHTWIELLLFLMMLMLHIPSFIDILFG